MKLLRNIYTSLLLLVCTFPFTAQANDYTYTSDGQSISITKYTGHGGAVTIPSKIDGLPVTQIGDRAFWRNSSVTSVIIPDSVTSIGEAAFAAEDSVSNITKVTIGNGVVSIGNDAFHFCDLTSITIPSSVTYIGERALIGCFKLTKITVDPKNNVFSSLDGVLYNKNITTLIQYPGGKVGSFIIPKSVKNMDELALWNCPKLTNVTIPEGITSIGQEAFAACRSLTTVTVPKSVTNIGMSAFDSCFNLKGIYFLGNAPNIAPNNIIDGNVVIYHLRSTTGWSKKFGGRPTAVWKP